MPPPRIGSGGGVPMKAHRRGTAGRVALGLAVLLGSGLWAAAQTASPEGKTVAEVQPRNNRITPSERVLAQIQTRAGRPYSQDTVQADVARLMATRLFARVTPYYQFTADDKVHVYFDVQEYPNIVQEIRYEGAKHIKDEELDTLTGLRRGVPLNPAANK